MLIKNVIISFLFSISLLAPASVYIQNVDSLKSLLNHKNDKEKLLLLINISDYYLKGSLDSCFVYSSRALLLAKKQNVDSLIANAYNKMGMASHYKGNNTAAVEYFTLAIEKYKLVNEKEPLAASYVNLGVIYYSIGEYRKAINSYQQALEIFGKKDNNYLSTLYDNLGLCYQEIDSPNVAIKYFKKSIEIKKGLNNIDDVYNTLSSISMVYRLEGQYDKALINYNKILDYAISIKDDRKIAISYLDIGECYFEEQNFKESIKYYNLGLEKSKKAKLNSLVQIYYQVLSDLYEKMGDNAKALAFYKMYSTNKDSSLNDVIYKKLSADIAKIKNDKIRFQQKLDELEIQKQKNISLILVITIILFLIIVIVIFVQVRIHQKKNKELEKLLVIISDSEKKLKDSNATKDKFFSIIAHDLKNPLSAFISVTNFLISKSETITEEMHSTFLIKMKTSAEDLNSLLDNLLSWARSQMNKIEYYPQVFDLNLKINEIIALNKTFADNKSISVINKIEGELDVFADDNLVKTIIRNILSNAIKFTNVNGKITIFAYGFNDKVELHIADNGVGITKKKLNELFEVKSCKKESVLVNENGTGLGLVICKEFIEINKGSIKVESKENIGSDFIISLPKHR